MFTDISSLLSHNPAAKHYGVAVTDVDADGAFEFVVAGFGCSNRVLKWAGSQLRDVTPPELADAERQSTGVAAGDFDGDGREEIYFLNTETFAGPKPFADRLMKARPDGVWEDLFDRPENRGARNFSSGRSVAVIDRRGVGRYGFFVANYGQPMRLYELSPAGAIADLAPALGLARVTGGRGLLAAAILSDATDLFCGNENGPNFFYRNTGQGTFEEMAVPLRLHDPEEQVRGVAVLDPQGDGRLSPCWANWEGPHRLTARRAEGGFKNHATAGFAFPSMARTLVVADFDNDGFDEVFFNNLGEANRLYRVRPDAAGPDIVMIDPGEALLPESFGTGAAIADVDRDGVLELLVAHGEAGHQSLSLFKSRLAAGNDWLRVRPLTRFGGPARGAVVRLEANGRQFTKPIDSGSGYLCQMEPVAHFGLGRSAEVHRLTITWPDGTAIVIDGPGVNRTLTVPYPRG